MQQKLQFLLQKKKEEQQKREVFLHHIKYMYMYINIVHNLAF